MLAATAVVVGSLIAVLAVVLYRGLPAIDIPTLTQVPRGGFYSGKGEGGILNAIVGSLYLVAGATPIAFVIGLPIALYINEYAAKSKLARFTRRSLDLLWSIPSIIYGAFGFTVMIFLGMRASLIGGIVALTLLELPIMTRAMDEVIRVVPAKLKEASYALGATKLETTLSVVCRQALPGLLTAVLLAVGRAIGDAASILFTAGYTDNIPGSLLDPVASLPLAIFFQLSTPFPVVQQKAYAAAAVLLILVLSISVVSRLMSRRFTKHIIR